MNKLTHPATGHEVNVDDESVEFWKGAGYRADSEPTAKRAPAKKATTRKSSTTKK